MHSSQLTASWDRQCTVCCDRTLLCTPSLHNNHRGVSTLAHDQHSTILLTWTTAQTVQSTSNKETRQRPHVRRLSLMHSKASKAAAVLQAGVCQVPCAVQSREVEREHNQSQCRGKAITSQVRAYKLNEVANPENRRSSIAMLLGTEQIDLRHNTTA